MISLYLFTLILGVCIAVVSSNDSIVHPCPRLSPSCIRGFFVRHSCCKPAFGSQADIQYPGIKYLPIPNSNMTLIWRSPHITGLDKIRVVKLYHNTNTNKLVIEVFIVEGMQRTSAATIKYYFKGCEPLELTDHFSITYRQVSMTAIVPFDYENGIRWQEKEIYTYFGDSNLPMNYGEALYNSDPEVKAAFCRLIADVAVNVREAALVLSSSLLELFFNTYICEF